MEKRFIVHPRKPAYGKTTVISARIPDEMVRNLDSICQKTGRTRNELFVMCLDYALSNLEIADGESD